MGYAINEPHIRVRTNLRREWIWELITQDGHVACASEGYAERDPCEAEARSQGLRVVGGRKQARGRQKRRPPGLRIYATGCGLWRWEYVDPDGDIAAASSVSFLTREECERDVAQTVLIPAEAC